MDVTLPADLTKQFEQELASGHYRSPDEVRRMTGITRASFAWCRSSAVGRTPLTIDFDQSS